MDKIKPVSFSDETINEKDFVGNQIRRKAPVDPDSGSGSGSGNVSVSGVNGSGDGTIFSSIGGSWNAECDFMWTVKCAYQEVVDILGIKTFVIESAQISLYNIHLRCDGVPAGSENANVRYEPLTYIDSNLEISNNRVEVEVGSGCTQFDATFHSKPLVLKVTEITKSHDSTGKETENSEVKTETKVVTLEMTFNISPYILSNSTPNVTFRSCIIS